MTAPYSVDMMRVSSTNFCTECCQSVLLILAIIIPDDVAEEKAKALLALGADLERVRPASIVDKKQVCNFETETDYVLANVCFSQYVVCGRLIR